MPGPNPEIGVDVSAVYPTKLQAYQAHSSQFPKDEEDLEWMKERDSQHSEVAGATYIEVFREMKVW